MSQPKMLGSMPFFNQASGLPKAPLLADLKPAENGIAQGPVIAPAPCQQLLKWRGCANRPRDNLLNSGVNAQNLNMKNEKEGLTMYQIWYTIMVVLKKVLM